METVPQEDFDNAGLSFTVAMWQPQLSLAPLKVGYVGTASP